MKKIFLVLFIVFSFFSFAVTAQEPAMLSLKVIGGNANDDVVSQVTKTADGGFIIGISSNSAAGTGNIDSLCTIGGNRSIFIKYNADASILEWSKCYLGTGDTGLGYMFPQSDGGNVFGGEYMSGYGFYICKQDALASIVWSHGYSKGNGALLFDMISTNDGGYIMAGNIYYVDTNFTTHYGSSGRDIGVLKLDSNGNKVWCKVIGGTGDEIAAKVIAAPSGGCYIIGTTTSNNYDCTGNHGSADAYLARLDSNGNILWHKDLGGTGDDGGVALMHILTVKVGLLLLLLADQMMEM